MDYENLYKEALIAVKELKEANPNDEGIQNWINDNFPELKKSEDERIRGAIIDHLKDNNLTEWAAWLEKQGEQKEQTLLNDNNKKYHRVPSTTLKRLYMNEAKYELLKEDITDGYIDTFVKEGSHNYLKIKIPMILCPTNCKKGDKVKLIIVKDK